jgi:hypothetical protein
LCKRRGQQGNVYQAHQHGRWNPRSTAYGRFWIDIPDGERERRTVSLGLCATQWVARLRLREYIERAGISSKHTLLDSRNVLDVLQQAGRQGGYHAFRRFRFAVLRKVGVPDDLIKLWLGHSQNLIDLYAAQLRYDETYRREWCEKAGLGFDLGELGYKSEAPIRPSLVA